MSIHLESEIGKLRERLLDLSLRNPLLNYRRSVRRTLDIVDELPDQIYARLVDAQQSFRFDPLELVEEDAFTAGGSRRTRNGSRAPVSRPYPLTLPQPDAAEGAGRERRWRDNRLQTNLAPPKLESTLRSIQREANNAIAETGINYLHLALGFLAWSEADSATDLKLAPLILIPVHLERSLDSSTSEYRHDLSWTGDEVTSNVTLIKKLEKQGLRIPEFDSAGTPESYWESVADLASRNPGWEVRREALLGFFSFHKLSMYIDVDPANWQGQAAIDSDSLISRLVCGGEAAAGTGLYAPDYEIDRHQVAQRIHLPADADSSQHSALCDIASGKNLVIEGPPGTGKSQTITNAIADAIASGKTVLFVAEKLAALEVVSRRLADMKLDPFCLELHSHSAAPKHVMESFARRLQLRPPRPQQIAAARERHDDLRRELDSYLAQTSVLAGPDEEPLYSLFWRVVEMRGSGLTAFRGVAVDSTVDRRRFAQHTDTLRVFSTALSEFPHARQSPWWGFFPDHRLNPNDLEPIRLGLQRLADCAADLDRTFRDLAEATLEEEAFWRSRWKLLDADLLGRLAHEVPDLELASLRALAVTDVRSVAAGLPPYVTRLENLKQQLANRLLVPVAEAAEQAPRAAALVEREMRQFGRDVTLAELTRYQEWITTTLAALRELAAVCGELEQSGFGTVRAINQLERARTWVGLIRHPVVREDGVLNQPLFFESAKQVFREAVSRATLLAEKEERVSESVHLPSVPPREDLLALLGSLRAHERSFLRVFRGEYRRARRELARFARAERKLPLRQWIQLLEELESLGRDQESFDGDATCRQVFGSLFAGRATNWEHVKTLFDWVHTAKKIGWDYERAASLVSKRKLLPSSLTASALARRIRDLESQFTPERLAPLQLTAADLRQLPLQELHTRLQRLSGTIATVVEFGSILKSGETSTLADVAAIGERVEEVATLAAFVADRAQRWSAVPEHLYQLAVSRPDQLAQAIDWIQQLAAANLSTAVIDTCLEAEPANLLHRMAAALREIRPLYDRGNAQREAIGEYGRLEPFWLQLEQTAGAGGTLLREGLVEETQVLLASLDELPAWGAVSRTLAQCQRAGLAGFAEAAITAQIPVDRLADTYRFTVLSRCAEEELALRGLSAEFSRHRLETLREEFQSLDRELLKLTRSEIAAKAAQRVPPEGNGRGRVGEYTQMSLIRHEIQKQQRHCRIRDLMSRAGQAVQALKPCFLMSPLSVSRYLAVDSLSFDLVIMDEASQIKPEDALGTVLRAKQLVVVGDPKQLPPTSFFDQLGEEVDEESSTAFDNTESILEVAMKAFQPYRRLRWHYRSAHQSLIQFSNHRFYDDDLVIFPAPTNASDDCGIRHHYVQDGTFSGGANVAEAQAVVRHLIEHAERCPDRTVGVGTFNKKQADLIQELLDKACDDDPLARRSVERLRQHEKEPLFIKNLENLQGDERDVIVISYTYGRDPQSGRLMQRFGPINSQTGWRRLNVLATRARRRMEVFSSILPSEIVGGPDKSRGVNAYRDFLEFCRNGTLRDHGTVDGRDAESPFELAVARVLIGMGLETVPQVGVAGYFIDIGVRRPGGGDFLLGVECDGATYHSSKSARDRDRLREEVIRSRGWQLHRIWSTDWFLNQKYEEERLRTALLTAANGHG